MIRCTIAGAVRRAIFFITFFSKRLFMGFTCGIVGLPNVGKSTIFNALTSAKAAAANFPFCTIEPNTGAVPVPDPRLTDLAELAKSEKVIPTQVTFVDIAGLIKGASQGEGLGNQFLGHIRSVDAIAHVVQCFHDENVVHVDGEVSPARDIDTIETELIIADHDSVGKAISKLEKVAKSGDKEARARLDLLQILSDHLSCGKPARTAQLEGEPERIASVLGGLITAKPVLYVANCDESEVDHQPTPGGSHLIDQVATIAKAQGAPIVVISGKVESEVAELPLEERAEYLEALGLSGSGLDRLAIAGYQLLGLITFFTAGPKEARAWTAPQGWKAPQCAGRIHSDFERGFIRAEVIGYADYTQCGSELRAKEAGKMRVEGKEYVMQDGDIVHFRFNV
jgi:GTP-binding protein YchF